MRNHASDIWDGIDNGESFPVPQMFEDQEQHYDFSQLEDPGVHQTYNSVGYYLPSPNGLYNHRTNYTTSDFFDVPASDINTPLESEPGPELELGTQTESDVQWPILQTESSEICFGMVWKAQRISGRSHYLQIP